MCKYIANFTYCTYFILGFKKAYWYLSVILCTTHVTKKNITKISVVLTFWTWLLNKHFVNLCPNVKFKHIICICKFFYLFTSINFQKDKFSIHVVTLPVSVLILKFIMTYHASNKNLSLIIWLHIHPPFSASGGWVFQAAGGAGKVLRCDRDDRGGELRTGPALGAQQSSTQVRQPTQHSYIVATLVWDRSVCEVCYIVTRSTLDIALLCIMYR